ncbi:ArsR/SmtB family transcription factor [Peptostreptococcus equinus]|uniref:Metalloregulator ArsR/SmtB family transcription factor n=1 Tax=Peptostreptococcus equinus TaxID=3003601 RepID=A0ABY7JLT9_9FIRM|nr:metalloregulator ArsR/SmtB family transcription factor [Peptostreptococcus sp. CBA3647]WAW14319.1 metalloregulator ArsR/SmtB family transcription factor [Peptostreptococcus sp. CBA3647]
MNKKIISKDIEVCQEYEIHEDKLSRVEENKPSEDMVMDLSELFKVLGDKTRIQILYALLESEMCVCDIAEYLNMTQSAISHQLRVLKSTRLVKFRKEGKTVYYSIDDEHVKIIFDCGLAHIKELYY